jgi:hypothetical protein
MEHDRFPRFIISKELYAGITHDARINKVVLTAKIIAQKIEYPPSTGIVVPITKSDACDATNTAVPAISSRSPQRLAGVRARIMSLKAEWFGSSRMAALMLVVIHPGAIALT